MSSVNIVGIVEISPFPTVFYLFQELSAICTNLEIVVCKFLSLEESKICRLG